MRHFLCPACHPVNFTIAVFVAFFVMVCCLGAVV